MMKESNRAMWNFRMVVFGCLFLFCCTPGRSDAGAIQTLFRSILAERDDAALPKEESVGIEFSNTVGSLKPAEIQSLLPLARQCMLSERQAVRGYGISFLALATLRTDSAGLLEPYMDDVAQLLNDPDPRMRNSAILILGSSKPIPPPKGIAYLGAHLGDKNNTPDQINLIAGTLIAASPDAATFHKVVAAVRQRPDIDNVKGRFIEILGTSRTKNSEALAFIRDSLTDRNPEVRGTSIEAIRKMPKDVRDGFSKDLERIADNPDETREQRDRARQVIVMQ